MNVKISLFCLSVCFTTTISKAIIDSIEDQWRDYKHKYNRNFDSAEDEQEFKSNFERNVKKINEHNEKYAQKIVSYKLGINKFTDLSDKYIFSYKGPMVDPRKFEIDELEDDENCKTNYPNSFDLRENGTLFGVDDEGECISDWAFTTVGLLEGYLSKKKEQFKPFSKQELIECSKEVYGNNGCEGGDLNSARRYIQDHGLSTEELYPYTANVISACKANTTDRDGIPKNTKIECHRFVRGDEGDMARYVHCAGPVAAMIYAPLNFFFYSEGIFTGEGCKPNQVDYNVLIVGYKNETNPEEKYWIVKNWMGEDWGDGGYAKIKLDSNVCGIADKAYRIKAWAYDN